MTDLPALERDLLARVHNRIRWDKQLVASVLQIEVLADGTVEAAPDPDAVGNDLQALKTDGFRSIAIVFMHSYAYPEHERAVADVARGMGFDQVSVSHEVSGLPKNVGRGATTEGDG